VHGSSLPTSRPERASYWLKPALGKSNVYLDQQQASTRSLLHFQERSEYPKVPSSDIGP
jgi:hypothetical protein